MTHVRLLILALILLLVLCFGPAHAQQNSSTSDAAKTADAELREKAFKLLESLATQLSTLQSAENRARIGSNIAGSIWTHDEKRARALFQQVAGDINLGLQNLDIQDPEDLQISMVFTRLREDTVERIAKHDAEIALSFLNATKLTSAKRLPEDLLQSEQQLEMRLARRVLLNNPDVTLTIARQSLARGFSDELPVLFVHLNQRHKEQALILYKEFVAKLGKMDLAQDDDARHFALNLGNNFAPPIVDDSSFRELINLFTTTTSTLGCKNRKTEDGEDDYFCRELLLIIDRFERRSSSPRAERRLNVPNDSSEPGYLRQAFFELDLLAENGTIDQMLALASKYPEIDFAIYSRALQQAEADGELDRAQKIATQYPGDPQRQKLLLGQVDRYKALVEVNEEQLAEAQRKLNSMPRVKDRLELLLSLAMARATSDRKTVLKLLDQASGLIDALNPGKDQIEAQIILATMYCLAKNERGFAIMESLLPPLNELVATAAKLDSFDTHYLRDGEWNMSANGSVGVLLTHLADNAGYFAWFDFDRAVTLAAQFERAEIRMMAQLKLAQGILAGPPKRLAPFHTQRTEVYRFGNLN